MIPAGTFGYPEDALADVLVDVVTLAGYTSYFLWLELPNLCGVLRRKAKNGCRVRFLLGDPDSEATRHREAVEDVPLTVSTRIRIHARRAGQARRDPRHRGPLQR